MKRKTTIAVLCLTLAMMGASNLAPAQDGGDSSSDVKTTPLVSKGTFFDYGGNTFTEGNLTLTSSSEVEAIVYPLPTILSLHLKPCEGFSFQPQITISGLEPSTEYHIRAKGESRAFQSDGEGKLSFEQDISGGCHIAVTLDALTVVITEDTTLQADIYDTVYIEADNITLDGNGYNIFGDLFIEGRTGVTVKNIRVRGILFITDCTIISVQNTTIKHSSPNGMTCMIAENVDTLLLSDCNFYAGYLRRLTFFMPYQGADLIDVSNSRIIRNDIGGALYGLSLSGDGNITKDNTFSSTVHQGLILDGSENEIFHNNFDGVDRVIATAGNTWNKPFPTCGNHYADKTGPDNFSGPGQDQPGSDGIVDEAVNIPGGDMDQYPFVEKDGWLTAPTYIPPTIETEPTAEVVTDSDGLAVSPPILLPNTPGESTIVVSVPGTSVDTVIFTVTAVDPAQAPAAPVIQSPSDGATLSTATPQVSGTAPANLTVRVVSDGLQVGETTADASGFWSLFTSPLSSGSHTLVAYVVDESGVSSAGSDPVTITVSLPAAPAAPQIEANVSRKTNDATPRVWGSAEASITILVFSNGDKLGQTQSDSGGNWNLSLSQEYTATLSDGAYSITARAQSQPGVVSDPSNAVLVTIDTRVAPPSGLTVTPLKGKIHLTWKPSPDYDVIGYEVWRKQANPPVGTWDKIHGGVVVDTKYCDSGLSDGTTYIYKVRAVDNTLDDAP